MTEITPPKCPWCGEEGKWDQWKEHWYCPHHTTLDDPPEPAKENVVIQHPYRCETCDHFIGKATNFFGVDQPFCKNPIIVEYTKNLPDDPGCTPYHQTCWIPRQVQATGDNYYHPMSEGEVTARRILGCCSHSDCEKVS